MKELVQDEKSAMEELQSELEDSKQMFRSEIVINKIQLLSSNQVRLKVYHSHHYFCSQNGSYHMNHMNGLGCQTVIGIQFIEISKLIQLIMVKVADYIF